MLSVHPGFPVVAPRCALVLLVVATLVFSTQWSSGAWGRRDPISVDRDSTGEVDIRVRDQRRSTTAPKPAAPAQPEADDAPKEFDETCVVPNASLSLLCLAGSGGNPRSAGPPTVLTVALEARSLLAIPPPVPTLRPLIQFQDGGRGGVTGAPIWLWTDPRHWSPQGRPLTRRVQAGSVWAVVNAAPVRVVWRPGDGATVTCLGPGTPLTDPARGLDGSPDCGHTYRRTSTRQPGGRFATTVSVVWAVTWVGSDGSDGALAPLAVTVAVPYTVRQGRAQLVR